jgi:hypothetical protein
VKLPPRSRWIAGSAVLTTVMSSKSMKVATQTAPSVHHLRSVGAAAVAVEVESICGLLSIGYNL